MAVSLSGIGRFLVWIGVSEPNARVVLRDVRAEGGLFDCGEQIIDSVIACRAMGPYGDVFWAWISERSYEALMDLGRMGEDFLKSGTCVALAETLVAFTQQPGVRPMVAARMLRRAGWYHDGSGVLTCHDWGEFIPESLMAAWLEFNFLPPLKPEINLVVHTEEGSQPCPAS